MSNERLGMKGKVYGWGGWKMPILHLERPRVLRIRMPDLHPRQEWRSLGDGRTEGRTGVDLRRLPVGQGATP
jgi:hypothetical protein